MAAPIPAALAPELPGRGGVLLPLCLVAAVGLAVYSNTFGVPFQLDDGLHLANNPTLRDVATFLSVPRPASRWVAFFTFAVDGSLHGGTLAGYHLTNLVIHLAAATCVYFLTVFACRRVGEGAPALARQAPVAALAAALLFVAHPIQTQAVTYLVQRLASLVALFYLGAVLCHAHAATARSPRRRRALQAASLALAALAVFTKENAATLPVALALFDLAFLPGTRRERVARLAPAFALTAAAVLLVLRPAGIIAATGKEVAHTADPAAALPAWTSYLLSQGPVILAYLRLLVLPVGQNVDHDFPLHASPWEAPVVLSFVALAAIFGVPAALAWRARASGMSRIVLFAIGWFLVTLSVESSVLPLADLAMEHRVYLPSAGAFLLAGCGAAWALDRVRSRAVAIACLGVPVAALAAAAHLRNEVWRDPYSLWSDAISKSPAKSRPYAWLGQLLIARGDPAAAARLLEVGVRQRPVLPHQFVILGDAYRKLDRLADAEQAFRTALSLPVGTVRGSHLALGLLLLETDRMDEACPWFEAELANDPENAQARENLGSCLFVRGDLSGAIAHWSRVVAAEPSNARVHYDLALAFAASGDETRAADAYRRFLAFAGQDLAAERDAALQWLAQHGAAAR